MRLFVGSEIVLIAALVGAVVGWIGHLLLSEPDQPTRERQLVEAYSQGWRACERFSARSSRNTPTE